MRKKGTTKRKQKMAQKRKKYAIGRSDKKGQNNTQTGKYKKSDQKTTKKLTKLE